MAAADAIDMASALSGDLITIPYDVTDSLYCCRCAMEFLFLWTAIALVLLIPTVLLAFVGLLFLTSLTKYNRPIVPRGEHGKSTEMSVVEGRDQFQCWVGSRPNGFQHMYNSSPANESIKRVACLKG